MRDLELDLSSKQPLQFFIKIIAQQFSANTVRQMEPVIPACILFPLLSLVLLLLGIPGTVKLMDGVGIPGLFHHTGGKAFGAETVGGIDGDIREVLDGILSAVQTSCSQHIRGVMGAGQTVIGPVGIAE